MNHSTANISVDSVSADIVNVSVQFTDAVGQNFQAMTTAFAFLSDDNAGLTASSPYSSPPTIGNNGHLFSISDTSFNIVSNNDGMVDINFVNDSNSVRFLVIVWGNGLSVVSPPIVHEV